MKKKFVRCKNNIFNIIDNSLEVVQIDFGSPALERFSLTNRPLTFYSKSLHLASFSFCIDIYTPCPGILMYLSVPQISGRPIPYITQNKEKFAFCKNEQKSIDCLEKVEVRKGCPLGCNAKMFQNTKKQLYFPNKGISVKG